MTVVAVAATAADLLRGRAPVEAADSAVTGESQATVDALKANLRSRLGSHAATHWQEFAAIIASGSLALAVVPAAPLFGQPVEAHARILLGGMLLVSIAASALAYFSIQVGSVGLFGPTTTWEVGESFSIAAAQIAMPLWLGHVMGQQQEIGEVSQVFPVARHWLGLLAWFTCTASITNLHASKRRESQNLPRPVLRSYEDKQRQDRRGAFLSALILCGAWIATLVWDPSWITTAVTVLVYFFLFVLAGVLVQQSRTLRDLSVAVALVPGRD